MADGAGQTRARIPRAAREEQMLDAAELTFAEHGFGGASMDRIAAGSGITKALLYQYFGSKEQLYTACVERARSRLFERIREAGERADDRRGRLRAIVEVYFEDIEAQRSRWYLLYGDAPREAVDGMRERNAQTIAELLRIDFAGAEHADVQLVAHLIVGAGEQVGRWWREHDDVPRAVVEERFAAAVGAAVEAGLR